MGHVILWTGSPLPIVCVLSSLTGRSTVYLHLPLRKETVSFCYCCLFNFLCLSLFFLPPSPPSPSPSPSSLSLFSDLPSPPAKKSTHVPENTIPYIVSIDSSCQRACKWHTHTRTHAYMMYIYRDLIMHTMYTMHICTFIFFWLSC